MKKILFISTNESLPWGGSELCWSQAAMKLVKRGIRVAVSAKDWGIPIRPVQNLAAARCEIFLRKPPSLTFRAARQIFKNLDFQTTHLRSIAPDSNLVVVCQGGNVDGLLWMEACLKLKLRYVVIAQAAAEPWWPDDDEARRLSQCYVGAAASYFVSAANLELSSRQFGSALPRARVIRNPFGVRYDAAPPWPENPTGELRLACVGRLDVKAKGQDILLRVLALPAWRGRSVHLTLAGDGVNRQTLCAMVKNLELNNVQFAGHINDLENFWAQHHVLVLPSRIEGMPLALVEAMLCNRVPIVTDVVGHAELVRDGVNGFLAKAPTVELLNDAMNKVWDAKAQLQTIGSSAGRTVRNWVSEDPVEDFVGDLSALL